MTQNIFFPIMVVVVCFATFHLLLIIFTVRFIIACSNHQQKIQNHSRALHIRKLTISKLWQSIAKVAFIHSFIHSVRLETWIRVSYCPCQTSSLAYQIYHDDPWIAIVLFVQQIFIKKLWLAWEWEYKYLTIDINNAISVEWRLSLGATGKWGDVWRWHFLKFLFK